MTSKNLIVLWFDDDETKTKNITKIKKHFLNQNPLLEINYFQELLSYSSDINDDIRESIAGFIEDVGKKFQDTIPDILPPLSRLVSDKIPIVSKRAIRASSWILKAAYKWMVAPEVDATLESQKVWKQLSALKTQITKMVDNDNEGVRMQAIKFIESVVLFQTYLDPETPRYPNDFSLDDISLKMPAATCHKLEEEAFKLVDVLINFLSSSHITSINVIICMGSLGRIAKFRPKFSPKVVEALIRLRKELPPTLSSSQIIGVKKESLRVLETLTSTVKIKQESGAESSPPVKRQLQQPNNNPKRKKLKTVEISEDLIAKNLSVETAVEMVIDGMVRVPSDMTPNEFTKNYPEFSVLTDQELQRRSIAKSITTQFKQAKKIKSNKVGNKSKQERPVDDPDNGAADTEFVKLMLEKNITPLSPAAKQKMVLGTIDRIISSENSILSEQAASNKTKILLRMATFNAQIKKLFLMYISEDVKTRLDLALSLVYEEYALNHGFKTRITASTEAPFQAYNDLLSSVVSMIESHEDQWLLLTRLYLAVPVITKKMMESLKTEALPETLTLLRELIFLRPTNKLEFLRILLGYTRHLDSSISDTAVSIVSGLYSHGEFHEFIFNYMKANLEFLRLKNPPGVLFGINSKAKIEQDWSNATVQTCLRLFQALLKEEKSLIDQLVQLYPSITADARKLVKKLMESSIRTFGVNSPELLSLVESCPKGAECLVTRFVHTLTENAIPSNELVAKMREIYTTRSLDVIFLIPVLRGLKREEVFPILPKLITRNTMVTKEVIKRLFFDIENTQLVLTPAEFMIAVHNFKKEEADLKTVMICISLCLTEKKYFTQEILEIVINRLVDQTPLPIILMRTLMQTLPLYPEMERFVVNILQKLILKKVWEQPKLWQGFAKCCEILKKRSFPIIHQLPQRTIDDLFKIVPGLKNDYIDYLKPKAEINCSQDNNNENNCSKAKPFICIV